MKKNALYFNVFLIIFLKIRNKCIILLLQII